ncbi:MAG: hypothetical protein IKM77_12085 [Prevotella sp.]|nr:hypothetical protein [Prevotella sp.]
MARFLVKDGIYWDDAKSVAQQSQAAKKWLDETRRQNADKVVKDSYGRPTHFIYETERAILDIEHTYLYPHSTDWSIDKIIINVSKK